MQLSNRVVMKTNLLVVNGRITFPVKESAYKLLDIKPNNAEDGGFIFYDRQHTDQIICKIAYTEKRGKSELFYETDAAYRNQGYMTVAMECVLEWMRQHSVSGCLWLLIRENNEASRKIAQRYKFIPQGVFEDDLEWYCLNLETISEP